MKKTYFTGSKDIKNVELLNERVHNFILNSKDIRKKKDLWKHIGLTQGNRYATISRKKMSVKTLKKLEKIIDLEGVFY